MAEKLSVAELAAAVVAQDEDVRDSLKGLVNDMIKHMRYTMRHGEPSAKTALSKQIIPQLLTAINKVDADAGEAEERAAYKRLMAALAGDAPVDALVDTTPQATYDAPNPAPVPAPVPAPTPAPVPAPAPVEKKVAARKLAPR